MSADDGSETFMFMSEAGLYLLSPILANTHCGSTSTRRRASWGPINIQLKRDSHRGETMGCKGLCNVKLYYRKHSIPSSGKRKWFDYDWLVSGSRLMFPTLIKPLGVYLESDTLADKPTSNRANFVCLGRVIISCCLLPSLIRPSI